jgi:hypothetical protein
MTRLLIYSYTSAITRSTRFHVFASVNNFTNVAALLFLHYCNYCYIVALYGHSYCTVIILLLMHSCSKHEKTIFDFFAKRRAQPYVDHDYIIETVHVQ